MGEGGRRPGEGMEGGGEETGEGGLLWPIFSHATHKVATFAAGLFPCFSQTINTIRP